MRLDHNDLLCSENGTYGANKLLGRSFLHRAQVREGAQSRSRVVLGSCLEIAFQRGVGKLTLGQSVE